MNNNWLNNLNSDDRAKAERRLRFLKQLNANDPESWVRSEMQEDFPQTTTFMFLHLVRQDVVNGPLSFPGYHDDHADRNLSIDERERLGAESYANLIQAGVAQADLDRLARAAAAQAAENFLVMLDRIAATAASEQLEAMEDAPDWVIMEISARSEGNELTGRKLEDLHESFRHLYVRAVGI